MIVNTPKGRLGSQDDAYVRKAAIKYKIPYITTTAAAFAAARGIRARKEERDVTRHYRSTRAAADVSIETDHSPRPGNRGFGAVSLPTGRDVPHTPW